jgi:hypothetical protein
MSDAPRLSLDQHDGELALVEPCDVPCPWCDQAALLVTFVRDGAWFGYCARCDERHPGLPGGDAS